ncbi:NAD(P)H-dependent oxidoreductase [Streptomyces sp. ET3-23]|uniref:NADPH-dependent FMN reductase n=1 Tax=Streptomyces sp. ET3-23 TaxID=2885643 RepID=UPI001D104855|nr:NAD(P)H-dependent oxidoreductase [Streptomyces sp. ET3-23]MCC2280446.1 NAD(P)H-dependent oxidoreductase [Streptomyces sp. ET3-23]
MIESPVRLAVLVGSVREGRFAPAVVDWFSERVNARTDLAVDLIDLADHPLPLTMPKSPETLSGGIRRNQQELADRLAAADAFVVVTPEYNHTFPAALKNCLDWFLAEWAAKPVGFVSYGGMAGGLRAVEHLRQVFAELHAVTVRDSVSFHSPWEHIAENGRLRAAEGGEAAAKAMVDQLLWWARALRRARSESPYCR